MRMVDLHIQLVTHKVKYSTELAPQYYYIFVARGEPEVLSKSGNLGLGFGIIPSINCLHGSVVVIMAQFSPC